MAYIFLMAAVLVADQISKYTVRTFMSEGESINVIGDFFRLTYYENDGAAFSTLSGQRVILIMIPAIAIIAGLIYMYKNRNAHPLLHVSISFIVAGGAGNLIDRNGHV